MTTEYRPRSSSRASRTSPSVSSRRNEFPSSESVCGEQGSGLDESDRLRKSKIKRRSLTRADYPRESLKRASRSSEHYLPQEMIWENGATPEEAAALAQKKERRALREKEKEKEREKERGKDQERELSRAERREKRQRAKEERAKAREERASQYDSQTETIASTASPDELVIPVVEVFLERDDIHEGVALPTEAHSARAPTTPSTVVGEFPQQPSAETVPETEKVIPASPQLSTATAESIKEPARPKTPEQPAYDPVKTHRHHHSIDSTDSTATLRGNSNETSPVGVDGYDTAATFIEPSSGGSNSSSPHNNTERKPLAILPPIPATSAFYPPPEPSEITVRPRTRRPYSFTATSNPLAGCDQTPAVEPDQPTPRPKGLHNRRSASMSHQYPPPYSSGYQYPLPDPYHISYYNHQPYHPPPPHIDYGSYPPAPAPESQYATPAEQRHDPFQYMEQSNETTQRPSRKSRRRASVSFSPSYYDAYPAPENTLKIITDEDYSPEVVPEDQSGAQYPSDERSATSYHSLHSHKRSPSVSTTRSSLHTAEEPPNIIPEEEEPESDQQPINPYTWYPQGNELIRSPMPAPPPSPPPSIPASSPAETGYPLLARAVADNSDFQIYRRFGALNHRVLLHLQDEISEMNAMLEKLDESPQSGVRNRRGMVNNTAGEQKLQLLSAIAWKLEQYNKALKAYQDTQCIPTPTPGAVAAYSSFLHSTNPVAEDESQYLEDPADLVHLTQPPAPVATHSPPPIPTPTVAAFSPSPPPPVVEHQPPPAPPAPEPIAIPPTPQKPKRWYNLPTLSVPSPSPLMVTCILQLVTIIAILLAPHITLPSTSSEDQCAAAAPVLDWTTVVMKMGLWIFALAPAAVVGWVQMRMGAIADGGKGGMDGTVAKWGPVVGAVAVGSATGLGVLSMI